MVSTLSVATQGRLAGWPVVSRGILKELFCVPASPAQVVYDTRRDGPFAIRTYAAHIVPSYPKFIAAVIADQDTMAVPVMGGRHFLPIFRAEDLH
jgi:hypothetical protein